MTPLALLHLATGTVGVELERDDQVALAWQLAEEMHDAGLAGAYDRLRQQMPAEGLALRIAIGTLVLAVRSAYARGDRDAVAACFGVRGRGW